MEWIKMRRKWYVATPRRIVNIGNRLHFRLSMGLSRWTANAALRLPLYSERVVAVHLTSK